MLPAWLSLLVAGLVLAGQLAWAGPSSRDNLDRLADELQAAADARAFRPQLSARGNEAWVRRLEGYARRLERIKHANLDPQRKITYDLVAARLRREREHVTGGWLLEDLSAEDSLTTTIYDAIAKTTRQNVNDWRWTMKTLRSSASFVRQYQQLLAEGLAQGRAQPAVIVESALRKLEDVGSASKRRNLFLALEDELTRSLAGHPSLAALKDELHAAVHEVALPAHQALARFLRTTYLPRAQQKLGEDRERYLRAMEKHIGPGHTPEQLRALGEAEVARLKEELTTLARQLSPNMRSLPAFMSGLSRRKSNRYASAEDLLAHAEQEVRTAQRLARKMAPIPRNQLKVAPMAAADEATNSGFYSDHTFYLNAGKLLAGQRKSDMAALATHEAFGGHHLAELYIAKQADLPSLRTAASDTTLDEGWGLYSEHWRDEQGGFHGVDRVGFLVGQLWRAARLVVDTGLHTGTMTPRQAADYLTKEAFLSRSLAAVEVERYLNNPGQALAYYTGKQKLLQIRQAARDKLGEHFDERRFHTRLLKLGVVPMPVVARKLDEWANRRLGQLKAR